MVGVIRVEGKRMNSYIYYEENNNLFTYHKHKNIGNTVYLACSKTTCGARAIVQQLLDVDDNGVLGHSFTLSKNHNHFGSAQEIHENELANACKRRAETETKSLRTIFNEERVRFPVGTGSFAEIEGSMAKRRRSCQPTLPLTIQEYGQLLQTNARYSRTKSGEPFFMLHQNLGDEGQNIIFASPSIHQHSQQAQEIHMDGTFRCVPLLFLQLVTVHMVAHDHAFPFVYCLMSRKTAVSYIALLQWMRDVLNMTPLLFITDFEAALMTSVQHVFPDAQISGCHFHYKQALLRKAQQLGLSIAFMEDEAVGKAVRRAMALPLLPTALMDEGMAAVEEISLAAQNPLLDNLIDYVKVTWLQRRRQVLSVHGNARRTNNAVEAFHRNVNRMIPTAHPNVLAFTASHTDSSTVQN